MEIVQTPDTATYEAGPQTLEGDLWVEVGSQNDGKPCFLPDPLVYTPVPDADPASAMYGNAFAPGAEFDQHIDDCRAAVTTEEVQQAAAMAMKVLIDDEVVVIPLAGTFRLFGASTKVVGFEARPSGVNQRRCADARGGCASGVPQSCPRLGDRRYARSGSDECDDRHGRCLVGRLCQRDPRNGGESTQS
jgi:hypothetical protein